jgi:hypothetical protein
MAAADRRRDDGRIVQRGIAAAAQQKPLRPVTGVVAADNLPSVVDAIGVGIGRGGSVDGGEEDGHGELLRLSVVSSRSNKNICEDCSCMLCRRQQRLL